MKCPVCDKENQSMLCPQCGFDSSRDYGKYPTFGPLLVQSASSMRKQWQEIHRQENSGKSAAAIISQKSETPPIVRQKKTDRIDPNPTDMAESARKNRTFLPLLIAMAFVLMLGIWIGAGLGESALTEPLEPMQMETQLNNVETQSDENVLQVFDWRQNILRPDDNNSIYVYGTDILKASVQTVTFLDSLNNAPADAIDVSASRDGSVRMWSAKKKTTNGPVFYLYYAANGGIDGAEACPMMFYRYNNLKSIEFGSSFHTEHAYHMNQMFAGCTSLVSLDLSGLDISNVKTMSNMFSNCSSLTKLDLSGLNTSNVQNMDNMFYECDSLKELHLDGFDTSGVLSMNNMFSRCSSISKLDLEDFDTTNVQTMKHMFAECTSLHDLTLGEKFSTENADASYLFHNCPAGAYYQHLVR